MLNAVVLGGGVSGLSVGWHLSDKYNVLVLEKGKDIGGLAGTFRHDDYSVDFGPHKIYTQLDGVMEQVKELVGDELLSFKKSSQIRVAGKFIDYPIRAKELFTKLDPILSAKLGASYISKKLSGKKHEESYEDYIVNRFGTEIYNLIFKPYALKVWGDPKHLSWRLAKARLPVSSFSQLVKSMIFGAGDDINADTFYYPKYGIKTLSAKMAEKIEKNKGSILPNSIPVSINIKNNRVDSVYYDVGTKKKKVNADVVVSTIPIKSFIRLINPLPPEDVVKAVDSLKYRSLILVYLVVDKDRLFEYNWIFFPEQEFIFNRLSEQKGFSKYMVPEGKTVLVAEVTVDTDKFNDVKEDEIVEKVIADLEKTKLVEKSIVKDHFVVKLKDVYPIYDFDYRKNLDVLFSYLDTVKGIYSTGRQGFFNYNNTDHCMDMGKKTAEYIKKGANLDEWKSLRESFYNYRIVD